MNFINKLCISLFLACVSYSISLDAMSDDELENFFEDYSVEDFEEELLDDITCLDDEEDIKLRDKFKIRETEENLLFIQEYIKQIITCAEKGYVGGVLSLKELAARKLLCNPLNLEELSLRIPEELIEFIKQLTINDRYALPYFIKKIGKGMRAKREELSKAYRDCWAMTNDYELAIQNEQAKVRDLNLALDIIDKGTVQELNEFIYRLQEIINNLINIFRDGDSGMLESFSQDTIKAYTCFVKQIESNTKLLNHWQKFSPERQKELNRMLNKCRKELNLIFKAEGLIPFILQNNNVDVNFVYKGKTALDWALHNDNKEMIGALRNAGARSLDMINSSQYTHKKTYSPVNTPEVCFSYDRVFRLTILCLALYSIYNFLI